MMPAWKKWVAVIGGMGVLLASHLVIAAPNETVIPGVDNVDTFEYNYYLVGQPPTVRCAVIFRDADKKIVDWRWCADVGRLTRLPDGRYVLQWTQDGKLYTVYALNVEETYTTYDRENTARKTLPANKRRKLTGLATPTETPPPPPPAPAPGGAPIPPPVEAPTPPAASVTPTPTPDTWTTVNTWAW